MFRPIRTLIWIALIAAFIWFGLKVNLGHYTLFEHISRIWNSKETRDARDDIEESAKKAGSKVKDVIDKGNDRSTATDPTH